MKRINLLNSSLLFTAAVAVTSLVGCGRMEPLAGVSVSQSSNSASGGSGAGSGSGTGSGAGSGSTDTGSGAEARTKAIDYNDYVLQAVAAMPTGGGYSTSAAAFQDLKNSITLTPNALNLEIATKPILSFCSGATYLVFLKALSLIQKTNPHWKDETLKQLLVDGQGDGTGVWGRWNSNGPGTGRLFYELGAGENFDDFTKAKPGDFLKIWWNSNIGSKESGHSVVYMGTNEKGQIGIWSSNSSNPNGTSGMGIKWYARSILTRVLFSRLTKLDGIANASSIPKTDSYLADMLKRPSTPDEMHKMVGLAP
jgi:hypothetical protein